MEYHVSQYTYLYLRKLKQSNNNINIFELSQFCTAVNSLVFLSLSTILKEFGGSKPKM